MYCFPVAFRPLREWVQLKCLQIGSRGRHSFIPGDNRLHGLWGGVICRGKPNGKTTHIAQRKGICNMLLVASSLVTATFIKTLSSRLRITQGWLLSNLAAKLRWHLPGRGHRASNHHILARIASPFVRFGRYFLASFLSLLRALQLLILLLGEFEIDAAAPILNGMREHVSHLKVPETIAALNEFRDLGNVGKIKLPRKGCLKIGFKKLAVPTSAKHEVHIDAPHRPSLSVAFIAELLAWGIRLGKEAMAHGADFACQPHSGCGSSLTAHGFSVAHVSPFVLLQFGRR